MTEIVRVAIGEDVEPLAWPGLCPHCEAKTDLRPTALRVGRVRSLRPNLLGGLTMRRDRLYLSPPMCGAHAGPTRLANLLLDKRPAIRIVHLFAYLFAAFAIVMLIARPHAFFADFKALHLVSLIGLADVAALWWARLNASVRPQRFDPDGAMVEIRFLNDFYASKFKRMNHAALDGGTIAAPAWLVRPNAWKAVMLLGAIVIVFRAALSR